MFSCSQDLQLNMNNIQDECQPYLILPEPDLRTPSQRSHLPWRWFLETEFDVREQSAK